MKSTNPKLKPDTVEIWLPFLAWHVTAHTCVMSCEHNEQALVQE